MAGETKPEPTVKLEIFSDRLLVEHEKLNNEQFRAVISTQQHSETLLRAELTALKDQTESKFEDLAQAVTLAREETTRRDEKNNEFRSQLNDQALTFSRKSDVDGQIRSLQDKIDQLQRTATEREALAKTALDGQLAIINKDIQGLRETRATESGLGGAISGLVAKVDALRLAGSETSGAKAGQQSGWNQYAGVIVAVVSVIGLITYLSTLVNK